MSRRPAAGFTVKRRAKIPRLFFAGAKMQAFLSADDTPALSCYHIVLGRGKEIKPAYHKKAVELIWVSKGGGTARLGPRSVALKTGDALVIQPWTPHGFVAGRSGMTILAALSPRVDSQTDYHSCDGDHVPPKVLSGRWKEGTSRAR